MGRVQTNKHILEDSLNVDRLVEILTGAVELVRVVAAVPGAITDQTVVDTDVRGQGVITVELLGLAGRWSKISIGYTNHRMITNHIM